MTNWWPMIRIAWRTARRITGSPTRPTRRLKALWHVARVSSVRSTRLAGQHQAPGRGVDQHRVDCAHVPLPVGVAQLVADQLVGGALVGDAQQRLGHAHQQHAFLAAQVVLAHEGFDRALVLGARAHAAHQVGGGGLHLRLVVGRQARLRQQLAHVAGLVLRPGHGDRLAERRGTACAAQATAAAEDGAPERGRRRIGAEGAVMPVGSWRT